MAEFKINGTLNTTKGVKTKGTNYILVSAAGTDVQNAAELQAAYTAAAAMTPSSTNIITIVASPGYYNFDAEDFEMTDEYINLVSLDGNRSIIFNGTYAIYVRANSVYVNGVDTLSTPFKIDDLNTTTIENCKGGDYSFQNGSKNPVISGIFINCVGDANSFGDNGATVSGTFINCTAGNGSFGRVGSIVSGTFTNCTAGDNSFGYSGATVSGTFINCTAGDNSFGYSGTVSGTFTNCIGGADSFGRDGTLSGTFTNCIGGADSFGYSGTVSGTFTNCIGGADSFGSAGTLSGKLYYCRLTAGTFQTVTFPGITRLCLDGNNDENNQTSEP
jgi:hypothetical protein